MKKEVRKAATTPEGREKQLQSLAMDVAEKQLRDGTASPSIIVHFLKSASLDKQLELELLRSKNTLISTKVEAIKEEKDNKTKAGAVLDSLKSYGVGKK